MEKIIFNKFQGNGNDFIIIDSRNSNIFSDLFEKRKETIKELCDRRFGIGSDGIVFILNPKGNNDVKMRIFNSDGSEAEMCGNGIRCLVDYLTKSSTNERDITPYKIETNSGLKKAIYKNGQISVEMGKPIFEKSLIPTNIIDTFNNLPSALFSFNDFSARGYSVGMGNPHLIFFLENIETISVRDLGSFFEKSELFPEKTNVHFCKILNQKNISVKVWERGAGETLACGTGACAVHVAAYILGLCSSKTTITLPGGKLNIEWDSEDKEVKMTGISKEIFSGEIYIN